jgi:RHS repeat-associated protein
MVSDPNLPQTTTRVTNSQGWITSLVDAANNTTGYSYDALGNLTQVTKPGGGVVQMTYDLRSRKRTLTDPDAGTITYTYNAGGELLTEIVTGGRTSASTYDNLGRLATRTETANGKTFATTNTYDCANAVGKLCSESITQPSGSNTRTYQRDELSRVKQVTTSTTAVVASVSRTKDFISQSRFDSLSRAKLYSYPITGLTLTNEYNTHGYTTAVKELRGASTITHWQANSRNADGQINAMNIGGVTTTKLYDSLGRVTNINTGSYQAASMDWDKVGNLTRRGDTAANAVNGNNEYFCHDQLNRVTHSSSSAIGCASPPAASFGYSTLGNLTKAGVTTGYQANGNKLLTVNGATVVYDIGGNITFDGRRSYTYTPFDIPDSITQTISGGSNPGIYQSGWGFGPDKQRTFELMRRAPIGSSTFAPIGMTWFAGAGHFEFDEEIDANGNWVVKEFRHTISSPEGAIGVVAVAVNSGGSSITDRYFLKDHLGSNAGTFIGNSAANSLESRATYDVWGNRISSGTPALSGFDTSQRGYTGHEHLATYGLIHMNGRIYDPLLGRFLQADPIIQSPYDLQSYNRYAYVMNNPLAYTDPTGYSRWTNFRDRYGKTILAIGVSVVLGPGGYYGAWVGGSKVATAAAAGFAAGGIMGGNLNSALAGAVSGALFGAAGAMTTPTSFASYAAHAAAGCASAAASGGSCGSGAAGAVVGKLFTNLTVASLGQSSPGAHFAGAVIGGGMGSLAAGGRFQDGAFSAGLGYLFNELGSLKDRGYPERDRRFYSADDGKVETLGWQNPKDEKEGYGFRIKIRTDADQSLFVYGHVDPSSLAVSQGWRGSKIRTPWIGVLRLRVRFSPALMCL